MTSSEHFAEDIDEVESPHSEEQNDSEVKESTENEVSNNEELIKKANSSDNQVTVQNDITMSKNISNPNSRIELKCEICSETFSHKNTLKFHYRFLHKLSSAEANEKVKDLNETKYYPCDNCDDTFMSEMAMNN